MKKKMLQRQISGQTKKKKNTTQKPWKGKYH